MIWQFLLILVVILPMCGTESGDALLKKSKGTQHEARTLHIHETPPLKLVTTRTQKSQIELDQTHVHSSDKNVKYGHALKENPQMYSKKLQKYAFLLSFFFFGAGRIYVGHYIMGSIQLWLMQTLLILISVTTIISCFCKDLFNRRNQRSRNMANTPTGPFRQFMLLSIFWVPLARVVFIWWIHDVSCFAMNDVTDADGLRLQPW
eukprot:179524_1